MVSGPSPAGTELGTVLIAPDGRARPVPTGRIAGFLRPAQIAGPVDPRDAGQHDPVEALGEVRAVPLGQDRLEEEETPAGLDGLPAAAQDGQGLVVVPVVDDPAHHDAIAGGHGFEEAATLGPTA